jgi:hypothetical protein
MVGICNKKRWSLESELCGLAKAKNVAEALWKLGIVEVEANFEVLQTVPWRRSGSETYLLNFEVLRAGRPEQALILKACAPSTSTVPIEVTLRYWDCRRRLLQSHGVDVPKQFFSGKGVIVEEFIPYSLPDAFRLHDSRVPFISALARYAATLRRLGFSSRNPFVDLRSRSCDVVVIDFGSDLGAPHAIDCGEMNYLETLLKWCDAEGWSINEEERRLANSIYEMH